MIVQPPYESDRTIYHKLPVEDRWIMNKLSLAERFGYNCGPTGMVVPPGDYCVRPMMNLYGLGAGGFFFANVASGQPRNFPNTPGYFWCEWFDGDHIWTQYINDTPVTYSVNPVVNDIMSTSVLLTDAAEVQAAAPPLPPELQGISRYMTVERIGDKIIEASPRMMILNAYQFIIDDYRNNVDSGYAPVEGRDYEMGNSDLERVEVTWNTGEDILTGWRWSDVDLNRRPG